MQLFKRHVPLWQVVLMLGIGFVIWANWSPDASTSTAEPAQPVHSSPASKPQMSAVDSAVTNPPAEITPTSLADALIAFGPDMGDSTNTLNLGAEELGKWSIKFLTWKSLMALPRTKPALVMKDSKMEQGKRICASGPIVEITAESVDIGKVYEGEFADISNGTLYRFIAVHSSGELVQGSETSFCGVVTGKFDYSNSMGGESHSIQLVGLFELPENMK